MYNLNRSIVTDSSDGNFSILPSLSYNVDPRCNMRCEYCPPFYENYEQVSGRLPRELAKSFFIAAAKCSFITFRLSGGEPLLNPDHVLELSEIVRDLGTKGAHVRLNTNGVFLAQHAESLRTSGVNVVKVSLDTLDSNRFKEMTGSSKFADVLRGIEVAHGLGLHVELNMVYTRKNADDFWPLLAYCLQNDIPGLKVLDLVEYDEPSYWAAYYLSPEALIEELSKRYSRVERTALSGGRGVRMLEFQVGPNTVVLVKDCRQGTTYSRTFCDGCQLYPCQEGFYNLTLNSDGKLKPCRLINDKFVDIQELIIGAGDPVAVFSDLIRSMLEQHYSEVFFSRGWHRVKGSEK